MDVGFILSDNTKEITVYRYDEQQIMNGFIFNLSRIQSEAKLLFLRETIKSVLAISDNIHVRAQIFNFWLNFASLKEI